MRGPHPLNRLDQHNVPRGIWRLRRRHSDPLHRAIRSRSMVARASASSASSTAIRRSALASSYRAISFSVRRRARMLVLDSAGICIPKEKPQQGRQGFWKRTPLGGMGCEGSASPPHSACLSRSVLLFQAKDLFRHAPTTQIALDRRVLVKAGAASNVVGAGRFSLNDRVRTMIEGVRPPRAPPSIGGDGPHPAFQGSVATGRCDRS